MREPVTMESTAPEGVEIRWMTEPEKDALIAFSRTNKATKELGYVWTRWGNFGKHDPVLAITPDGQIRGFHAATFSVRSKYVNSYYQLVADELVGRGIGGRMVDALLQKAAALDLQRLKFKVPPGSAGERFWAGFGLAPFGKDAKHHYYDAPIAGLTSVTQLMGIGRSVVPAKELDAYTKRGVEIL